MHGQGIAHRDIKVENILLCNKKFKLADFGSASTVQLTDFSRQERVAEAFEEFEKHTTLMYRPPEMIDKYKGFPVTTQADVWMLGCVLFSLCFFQHPF